MPTRGDVLDRVTDLLEDKSTTTRTRLTPWVAFVLSEMKLAGILGPRAKTTVDLEAGDTVVDLPADVDYVEDVYFADTWESPLGYAESLAADHADSTTERMFPVKWALLAPRDPEDEETTRIPQIELYNPLDADRTLTVIYRANFATLTDDTDLLQLGDDLMTTAVWGVYRIAARTNEDISEADKREAKEEFRLSLARAKFHQQPRHGTSVVYRDI